MPLPLGVRNSRSEFGMEVILILGFLHYWVGVSQENAIQIMNFFIGLDLSSVESFQGTGGLIVESTGRRLGTAARGDR